MIEAQNIEYKEKFTDKTLETLCAFANTKGGTLYIGISNREVIGVDINNEIIRIITEKIYFKTWYSSFISSKKSFDSSYFLSCWID